ncbi:hypothetical protein F5Y00DRAFT_274270 [Daldinia vernicosa]|uniref:uncharacterized protein n=1 Tax=Daldinia vernicosa TaxID=114800 RepID=UPI002007BC75|nr:uncharacterized protein F5Y00DRAFT_274270 [Daldinia vernicosa]KAI0852048.1 hypothetical protein F5Y00DRAFT_274270 [Daldinia vernicosa]
MDPFAAIGFAGNIITFVDFGFKLISAANNIYESKSGASADNEDLSSMTGRLQQLTAKLKGAKHIGSSSQQNNALYGIAAECENASEELMKLLDKLKTKTPDSRRHALKAAVRNWRKSDQKSELEKRLDRCKQQLGLELLSSIKSDSLELLDRLITSGKASQDELRSLSRNIESLRQGTNVSCLSTEALGQVRSLVQLSDEAILKTRQARVLDSLRFQLMNERFEDIEEAYEKTFDWIFDISATGPVDNTQERVHDSFSVTHSLEEQLSDSSSLKWILDDASSMAESENSVKPLDRLWYASAPVPRAISRVADIPESKWQAMAEARDSFIAWLRKGTGIFYISGKPGSGKSTLMKHLVRHRKTMDYLEIWADGKKLVLGKFFFWKPGSDLQKNTNGLIRGLLHCLLSECPELIHLAFPEQWKESMQRQNVYIEHHECRQAFERLIEKQAYGQHKFVFFIDGLDEFEGHHADLARQLVRWTNGTQNVKLCISSREWPIFQDAFENYPRIRLHDLTRYDIQRFVRDRLCEMNIDVLVRSGDIFNDGDEPSNTYKIMALEDSIVEGSEGVFLWVSLVLRHIENGIANGDRIQDLMRLIESLPTDLEPMLKQLLDSIPANNRKLAYSMLSLAHFATTHGNQMCLMQYSFLGEYIENQNFAIDWPIRLFTASELRERLERSERRVYGVCKGFLELREPPAETTYPNMLGGVVRLIHRSITEFLESQHFKPRVDFELPGFDPFDALCQTYLGQLKRVRLPMSYFSPRASSLNNRYPWGYDFKDDAYNIFAYPSHPTFKQDILRIISQRDYHDRHWARPRFNQFLDGTYRTVANLETRPCILHMYYFRRLIEVRPENVIIIICILVGAHEHLPLGKDVDSKLVDLCASSCLYDIGRSHHLNRDEPFNFIGPLQTFFDRGASPDSKLGRFNGPEFHQLLALWCTGYTPSFAIIAFMLYHGVNPRFAIVIRRDIYKLEIDPSCYRLKVHFKSECPSIQPGNEVENMRTTILSTRALIASPQLFRIIGNYGDVIDLRTLVSIWFPDQSHVLQPVIDYILELGVLTNAHHRSELQARFGPLLRPFFDRDHPDFVGKVPPRTEWPGRDGTHRMYDQSDLVRISKIEEAEFRERLKVEETTVTGV